MTCNWAMNPLKYMPQRVQTPVKTSLKFILAISAVTGAPESSLNLGVKPIFFEKKNLYLVQLSFRLSNISR